LIFLGEEGNKFFKKKLMKEIISICGPSGAGKGTLIEMLMKEYPDTFAFTCSHTSRAQRKGEIDGVHYHFMDYETIMKKIEQGEFIEHAIVHGNVYGVSKKAIGDVKDTGKVCILDLDIQGTNQIKDLGMNCLYLFITAPSIEELEKRIRKRGSDNEESIKTRIGNARIIEEFKKTHSDFFDETIVNDDLSKSYQRLKEIINDHVVLLKKE
jgi:guanylate kinase